MAKSGSWLLLSTAPDQLTAEMWLGVLREHDIPAVISPGDTSSFMGISPFPCRLMVAGDYLKQARQILAGLESEPEPPVEVSTSSVILGRIEKGTTWSRRATSRCR